MNEYNIKSIRQDFKQKGIFYTQRELAKYIKNLLPENVDRVYDPTCGNGAVVVTIKIWVNSQMQYYRCLYKVKSHDSFNWHWELVRYV